MDKISRRGKRRKAGVQKQEKCTTEEKRKDASKGCEAIQLEQQAQELIKSKQKKKKNGRDRKNPR